MRIYESPWGMCLDLDFICFIGSVYTYTPWSSTLTLPPVTYFMIHFKGGTNDSYEVRGDSEEICTSWRNDIIKQWKNND